MKFLEAYQEVEEYHKFVYFRLLAFTGLRRGEAFALYETDVIRSEKAIDVNKTLAEDENGKNYVSHLSEHKKRSPLLKLGEIFGRWCNIWCNIITQKSKKVLETALCRRF
ncbi:hypothetical protein I6N95_00690 [Vagococcus sp. BWB3-3]|uniref:Tyr recombinase domain-containing protein n=1 Tax=Vagococcus allomyrinae TaxID=2794353 RepID=A0A940P7S4_9ENTE|nr:hypothetical protein [Vagococcus allomyrinae]MBP1039512.1 hypothetical protein [Vagococcus allomyrinae]